MILDATFVRSTTMFEFSFGLTNLHFITIKTRDVINIRKIKNIVLNLHFSQKFYMCLLDEGELT